jgi:uncharacterized membrane protein YphA (DoxX/SURF4 family)
MLSIFPNLYNYGILVPVILRLFLGLYLLRAAWGNYQAIKTGVHPKISIVWSIIKLIGGGFILSGFLIQPTAIFFALLTLIVILFKDKTPGHRGYPNEFYILKTIAYLALVVLGPGLFAIDLPL